PRQRPGRPAARPSGLLSPDLRKPYGNWSSTGERFPTFKVGPSHCTPVQPTRPHSGAIPLALVACSPNFPHVLSLQKQARTDESITSPRPDRPVRPLRIICLPSSENRLGLVLAQRCGPFLNRSGPRVPGRSGAQSRRGGSGGPSREVG